MSPAALEGRRFGAWVGLRAPADVLNNLGLVRSSCRQHEVSNPADATSIAPMNDESATSFAYQPRDWKLCFAISSFFNRAISF